MGNTPPKTAHPVVSPWLDRNTAEALHGLAGAASNLRQIAGVISADFATNTPGHGQAAVDRYMRQKMIETVPKHACRAKPLFMTSVPLGAVWRA